MSTVNSQVNALNLRLAFSDETLQARATASDRGFTSQRDSDRSQYSTLSTWNEGHQTRDDVQKIIHSLPL